ncbi:translation initiation factor IF-2-like [Acinonyx jubatus]|uniref:Translation initiation factor IF-2-like n=1 Tax=Acinonyx jubatus TaxID=32536 RepID=A0ABM3NUJ1_ACIJB|nr:translation initiation factor IF-2-like [Acinonyx jubatus]
MALNQQKVCKLSARGTGGKRCPGQLSPRGHRPGVGPPRQASPAGNPRTAGRRRASRSGARPSFPSTAPRLASSSATATAAGLPALLRRTPPRAEVRKTIKESREEDAAPSRRPGARAQVSLRRGLAQVQPRGADTRRHGPRGSPGPCTARRPPPRTHQRPPAPRRTLGRLPDRLSRRGAPRARPRPPRPGAAALLTPNFTSALRPQHPRRRGPGSHSHRAAGAAPTTASPHTAHACPRRLSPQTAAEIPKPALPARGDYKSRQAPRGSRQRGGPGIGRLPNSRGGGLGVSGRAARGALVHCAAVPPGTGSFRGAGAWLGVGGAETRGSLMSSARASRHGDL